MGKTKDEELVITTDVTDWLRQYRASGVTVTGEDDVVDLAAEGKSTGEIAKFAIVAQELGEAAGITQPPKILLLRGGMHDVRRIIERQEVTLRTNGHEVTVRAFMASRFGRPLVVEVEGELDAEVEAIPSHYLHVASDGRVPQAARDQLYGFVMGNVHNKLATLLATEGEEAMRGAARHFKGLVDEVVATLLDGGGEQPRERVKPR
jgi:hypothetical protein